MITPLPAAMWGPRERALIRRGFALTEATPPGIASLVRQLREDMPTERATPGGAGMSALDQRLSVDPYLWLGDTPPTESVRCGLLADLEAALGREGFFWLSALAVFPVIHPKLTLALGGVLADADGERLMTEGRLSRLCRLPWLRRGRMPDWLRLTLVRELVKRGAEAERARAAWAYLLDPVRKGGDQKVSIKVVKSVSPRLPELVGRLLKRRPGYGEAILLSFLNRRQPPELAVELPAQSASVVRAGLSRRGYRPIIEGRRPAAGRTVGRTGLAHAASKGGAGRGLAYAIAIGLLGIAVAVWAIGGLIGGSALVSLFSMLAAISTLALGLVYRRYVSILGADRRRPAERQAYDALRDSLSGGNLAARLYARSLTNFLDAVDRFFGDAGMADRTLFPHAFGLRRTPAPLWTAPALDRCLLLAFMYPIVTIFVIWAISGHVGPAEAALHLPPGLPGWRRGLVVAAFASMSPACFRGVRTTGWRSFAWFAGAVAGAVAIAIGFAGVSAGVVIAAAGAFAIGGGVFAGANVFAFPFAGAIAIAVALAGAIAIAIAGASASAFGVPGAVALAITISVAFAARWGNDIAVNRSWHGVFLSFSIVMMTVASVAAARLLSPLPGWDSAGTLLLLLGLLPLLNAPFDWISLGLTRALLRRGLELGGWAPYFLALVDAALAVVVIVALTLAMVIGVQTFDELAVRGGGMAVLPIDALFGGIAANPSAPEYWWLYALLVSSMIPSLTNLVISGTSLLRGLPGLPALLLRFMPSRGAVLKFDRAWIASVLTAQVAIGGALGILAQVGVVVLIIGYMMPWLGVQLLDSARAIADFDLPARLGL